MRPYNNTSWFRKFLFATGLGLALYSTPSYAQEAPIWDRIRTTFLEEKDKAKEKLRVAKEKAIQAKENLKEKTKRAIDFTKEATKGKSPTDLKVEAFTKIAKKAPVFNFETRKVESYDTVLRRIVKQNPEAFKGSDFDEDVVKTAVGLLYDPNGFSKYRIIDDGTGKYLTMEEAIVHLNKQFGDIMQELRAEDSSTIQQRTSTKSNIETLLNKEIVLREYGDVYDSSIGEGVQLSTLNGFDENFKLGDKTVNIYTSIGGSIQGLPLELTIHCEGEGNTSPRHTLNFVANRREVSSRNTVPQAGDNYVIFRSDEYAIALRIISSKYHNFGDDRAIKELRFRLRGVEGPKIVVPAPKKTTLTSKIAFLLKIGNNKFLRTINPDGSDYKMLSIFPAADQKPIWHPDGKYILYKTKKGDFYRVKPDGSDLESFLKIEGAYSLIYSPDGTQLAFAIYRKGRDYKVCIMNENRSDIKSIMEVESQLNNLFWTSKDHLLLAVGYGDNPRIIKCPLNGSGSRTVKSGFKRGFTCDVSSTGKIITTDTYSKYDRYKVCITDPGGRNFRMIMTPLFAAYPVWSPDGTQIALQLMDREELFSDLFVVNEEGSITSTISTLPGNDMYYSWSPNGKELAFTSQEDDIWISDVKTSRLRKLLRDGKKGSHPSWSNYIKAP